MNSINKSTSCYCISVPEDGDYRKVNMYSVHLPQPRRGYFFHLRIFAMLKGVDIGTDFMK